MMPDLRITFRGLLHRAGFGIAIASQQDGGLGEWLRADPSNST